MRYAMNRGKSKSLFRHTASRKPAINFRGRPMRGGIRM